MAAVAFVDESQIGGTGSGLPYILAASVLDEADDSYDLRAELLRLKPRGARKLHWTDATDGQRATVVDAVAGFGFDHCAFVRMPDGDDDRRLRRACIEMLVHHVQLMGVSDVVFESRGAVLDRDDLNMLGALRARKRVGRAGLRFSHAPAVAQPPLWMADAVAGTTGAWMQGDSSYFERFAGKLDIIQFD